MKSMPTSIRYMPGIILFLTLSCSMRVFAASAIQLGPNANIQAAVNAAPDGTTFVLTAGTYRMQSVKAKNNDVFQGTGIVDFNGSQVLAFNAAGNQWAASAKFDNFVHGSCLPDHPLCGNDQDLFIDGVYQRPTPSSQTLSAGSWYFDRASNQIYIPTNPEGHIVELGMAKYAFYGSASGVKIEGIIVEKYANPGQTGAIGGDSWANGLGSAWTLQNVEARLNHGSGVFLGAGGKITQCHFHHNGQLGVKMTGANDSLVHNEIDSNNQAGFLTGWEAGGGKFSATSNLLVQSNDVHDNLGEGLWTDTNNINTTYDNNTVVNNLAGGIMHEVSYDAVIKNNTVSGNAPNQLIWMENAQILVQNSSNVQVFGNKVEVPATGGNGITLVNQKRGSGSNGPWVVQNDNVHDNTITYLGPKGSSGIADDTKPPQSNGNSFEHNHYVLKGGGTKHWYWYSDMTWERMTQEARQEMRGNCCN